MYMIKSDSCLNIYMCLYVIKLNSCDQIKTVVIKAPKVMICMMLLH